MQDCTSITYPYPGLVIRDRSVHNPQIFGFSKLATAF